MGEKTNNDNSANAEAARQRQNCFGYVADMLGYSGSKRVYGLSEDDLSQSFVKTPEFDAEHTRIIQISDRVWGNPQHMVLVSFENGKLSLTHRRNSGIPVESTTLSEIEEMYPKSEFRYDFFSKKT